MMASNHQSFSTLHTIVAKVALAVAEVLNSQDSKRVQLRCRSLTNNQVQGLKRQLIQIYLEHLYNPMGVSRQAQLDLDKVAESLDRILDENYIRSFANDDSITTDFCRHKRLQTMSAILSRRPSKFDVVDAIHCDVADELLRLSVLSESFSNKVDDASSRHAELAYNSHNTFKRKYPDPAIALEAFRDPYNVRALAECLHQCFHRHWPCQLNQHKHDGALGECTQANMFLDPKWIIHGLVDGTFFVTLTGEGIDQECRVHIPKPEERSPSTNQSPCLLLYNEYKNWSLFLILDSAGQLYDGEDDAALQFHIQSDKATSVHYELVDLKTLLAAIVPTYAAKRVVHLIVARSLLLLLDGPWVGRALSMKDISIFCRIEEGVPRPFFDKIFISTRFGSCVNYPVTQKQRCQHPFPAIQALGILLAEIELGDRLTNIYRNRPIDQNQKLVRPGAFAETLRKECRNHMPEGAGVLRAIDFCIDKHSFENYIGRTQEPPLQAQRPLQEQLLPQPQLPPQNDPEFIKRFYMSIIRPLEEDLVDGANWTWDEINWKRTHELNDSGIANIISGNHYTSVNRSHHKKHTTRLGAQLSSLREDHEDDVAPRNVTPHPEAFPNGVFDAHTCVAGVDNIPSADEWFNELKPVHTILNSDRMEDLDEEEVESLVKVAVLDTGIDLNHPEFKQFRQDGRLDAGFDFVEKGKAIVDLDGHGTHVCHTLLRTAPYVKLYPIRVLRTRQSENSTPALIKKAIEYAIGKGVDIISMSFAFEDEEPEIKEALNNTSNRVLMFAAASNNRALRREPIGYPARVSDRVICVNSSTINDERSNFSPKGIPGHLNFSVVGENVKAAWALNKNNGETMRSMNGTSMATPIMAGIAAMLLDFSKKDWGSLGNMRDWNKHKTELWETVGMKSVFKRCMIDNVKMDGSYNFLKPWLLLAKEPEAIAHKITDALQSKYK